METAGTIIINGIIDGQDGQDGKDAAEVILTPGTIYFAGDDGKYVDDTQYVQVTVGMKVDGTACTISSIAVGTVPSGVSYTRNGTTLTFHNTASDYGDIEGSVSIVVTGTITSGGVTTTYTATGVLPIVCTQAGASVTSVDKYFKAISTNSAPAYDNTWTKNATPSYWSVYIRYLWCREYTNFSDGSGSWGSIYLHSVWGQQGTNGDTGPMCYIAGTYRDDIEYTSSAKQTVAVEEETGRPSRDHVYAGGDAVTGAATVILAMGAGKTAAAAIDEWLSGKDV